MAKVSSESGHGPTGEGIQAERVRPLNDKGVATDGDYVLYWMQQSQRAEGNHALEYAVRLANEAKKPLVVVFGLTDGYPDANARHYHFMLEGLRETGSALRKRGIAFAVQLGDPAAVAIGASLRATEIVCDRGYLRVQKSWREQVAAEARCRVTQVESDVCVPVEVVSSKAEYAARTIRPKIRRHLRDYLVPLKKKRVAVPAAGIEMRSLDLEDVDALVARLSVDLSVGPVGRFFKGGTSQARRRLRRFLDSKIETYAENRSRPESDHVSHMAMYLHFGQISPLEIAMEALASPAVYRKEVEAYLEELVVRRELAVNFVHYTSNYDSFEALPAWARATLEKHERDERPFLYTVYELENALTHDPYWNACMQEMRVTGYMHNRMRMYWGKKILEWMASPREAYKATLYLNNKYFLCGRDPNAYVNVLWVFGLHDRPWGERDVYGTVRSMSAAGLERKTDIDAYVRKVDHFLRS